MIGYDESMHMPATQPVHRKCCRFSGHVQGVGFRYTVRNIALQYAVDGYVKNLPDGCVELVIEGADSEMDHMVQAVSDRMGDYIREVNAQSSPATGEFDGFFIRH